MRLRPVDVHEQTFRMTFRGFDPVEVDGFLNRVSDEMERLLEERVDLEMELETERAARKDMESTLATATHLHHSIVEKAKEDARVTLHQAKLLAERLGVEAREEIVGLRRDIAALKERKATYLAEIGALSAAISRWVDRVEQGDREKTPLDQVAGHEPSPESFATQTEVSTETPTDEAQAAVEGEYEERELTIAEPEYESFPTAFTAPTQEEEAGYEGSEEEGEEEDAEYYQEDGPEEGFDDYGDEPDTGEEAANEDEVEVEEDADAEVLADEPDNDNGFIFRLAVNNVHKFEALEEENKEEGEEEEADSFDLTDQEVDGDEEFEVFDADSDLIDEALEILDTLADDPDDDGRG